MPLFATRQASADIGMPALAPSHPAVGQEHGFAVGAVLTAFSQALGHVSPFASAEGKKTAYATA